MLDWIVCHEMAHELNDRTFGFPGEDIYDEAWRVDGEERVWWIRKRSAPAEWSVDTTFRGR